MVRHTGRNRLLLVAVGLVFAAPMAGCFTRNTYGSFLSARGWRKLGEVDATEVAVYQVAPRVFHLHIAFEDDEVRAVDWEFLDESGRFNEEEPCGALIPIARLTPGTAVDLGIGTGFDGGRVISRMSWSPGGDLTWTDEPAPGSMEFTRTSSAYEATRRRRVWVRRSEDARPLELAVLVPVFPVAFVLDTATWLAAIATCPIVAWLLTTEELGPWVLGHFMPIGEAWPELPGE